MPFGNEEIETWQDFIDEVCISYGNAFILNSTLLNALKQHKIVGQPDFEDIDCQPEKLELRRGREFFRLKGKDPHSLDIPNFVKVARKVDSQNNSAILLAFQAYHDFRTREGLRAQELISKALETAGKGWKAYQKEGQSSSSRDQPEVKIDEQAPAQASSSPTAPVPPPAGGTQINIYGDLIAMKAETINFVQNRNTYIENRILDGSVEWMVDGKKLSTSEEIKSLLGKFEDQGKVGKRVQIKKGYVMYLNWRFDDETKSADEKYNRYQLLSAAKDEPRVIEQFTDLANSEVYFRYNVKDETELYEVVDDFKLNRVKADADYILVILNSHGCNRTQLFTDDLEPFDLYRDIVWRLDFHQFKKVKADKPRLYLVSACQTDCKSAADKTVKDEDPKNETPTYCRSPYFILFATVPNEKSYADKEYGTAFFRAINKEFTGGKDLLTMIYMAQERVDDYVGKKIKQTMSISHSVGFERNNFMFTPAKLSDKSQAENKSIIGHVGDYITKIFK